MSTALAIYENFEQTTKIAQALASSELVPSHFQKKPANVLIALEFAQRNDIAPFAAMQSLYVVSGKVGMSAAMAISLARKHNVWKSLKYVVTGKGDSMEVTAVATLHDDSEVSATVSMETANKAGWSRNPVWKSIPDQMLKYRAATFLIRSNFPEVLYGMQTVEEIRDVEAINVTPQPEVAKVNKEELKKALPTARDHFEEDKQGLLSLIDLHFEEGKSKSQFIEKVKKVKNREQLDQVASIVAIYVKQKEAKTEVVDPFEPEPLDKQPGADQV
jgi:hypothetical protein